MLNVYFCSANFQWPGEQYEVIIVLLDGEHFRVARHPEVFTSLGPYKRYDSDIALYLKGSGYSYMTNKRNYNDFVNSYPEVLL